MVAHPRLRVYMLTGKRTTLFWCRDTHNDWRSEPGRGERFFADRTAWKASGAAQLRLQSPCTLLE
jgi:hypothetical protein